MTLLPKVPGLRIRDVAINTEMVSLSLESSCTSVACPVCGRSTARLHSHYQRTLADLPWGGRAVRLALRVRRFRCSHSECPRRIFAERIPDLVASYARKTTRLHQILRLVGFALGGEGGARLLLRLGMRASPSTLLRYVVRGSPEPVYPEPTVVGIDDWAFRRGNRYGTIVVDLERHEVIDLLEDREAGSVAAWLKRHPEVRIVARDRSGAYAEAASSGAPQAVQVADRWHLMHNLAAALEEFLLQKRKMLREAATTQTRSPEEEDDAASVSPGPLTGHRPRIWYERQLQSSRKRHERLVEQWRDIRRLHLAGADVYDIARRLGVSRSTVYRYREREETPEPTRFRHKKRVLDPYVPYVLKRWGEGCRNGRKLYREIRQRGYAHDISNLGRLLAELRRAEAAGKPGGKPAGRPPPGAVHPDTPTVPTVRQVAALFLRREEKLTAEQKAYLDRLWVLDETSADAYWLTQKFAGMVRGLEGGKLDGWLEEAEASGVAAMRRFAKGLKKDLSAVRAGLTESWSNGPVEGFVHKLKLIKRQMYGRASFALLRRRVLGAS
ncbi:MAG: ISL3 family transposase [Actinomycetota bacterium]|nr:ISL3 family transposase [Actinomycetota bacterium]